jgi:two-component system phosphate regulon sensor histidine kinase PhoR
MLLITFLGLVGFFSASIYINRTNNLDMAKDSVMEITHIVANLYGETTDISAFVKAGNDTRITVISPDGVVLADSRPLDLGTAENRLNRPEIQAALRGSPVAYVRRSNTLNVDFIYYALKVDNDNDYVFIRVSIPVSAINIYVLRTLPLFLLILFAVAFLCYMMIQGMASRFVKPFAVVEQKLRLLSKGEYEAEPITETFDEADAILREINEVSLLLQDNIKSLHEEKNKSNYLLNNISDGIFTVDANNNIVFVNNAARGIFNATLTVADKNINYLTNNKTLVTAVGNSAAISEPFDMKIDGKIYMTTVKRLPFSNLTMTVLSDVTENRENTKRREEFFTNASHELKTPLTAIKAFNELTVINNQDENLNNFISGITRQTERMLLLIEGMLKLSELENMPETNPEPLSLSRIVNDVREAMETAINEKGIHFETDGDATIHAEYGHIYDLIKNLIENAVRYNNQNGKVTVKINENAESVLLSVSDTGIGISPEEQVRVFERFYRVEKSRSQKGGGTGLGLSIVKHICMLYGWKLELKSKPGLGTEIKLVICYPESSEPPVPSIQ